MLPRLPSDAARSRARFAATVKVGARSFLRVIPDGSGRFGRRLTSLCAFFSLWLACTVLAFGGPLPRPDSNDIFSEIESSGILRCPPNCPVCAANRVLDGDFSAVRAGVAQYSRKNDTANYRFGLSTPAAPQRPRDTKANVPKRIRRLPSLTQVKAYITTHVSAGTRRALQNTNTAANPARRGSQPGKASTARGSVVRINRTANSIVIGYPDGNVPRVGTRVKVFHDYLVERVYVGTFQIVTAGPSQATARPINPSELEKVHSKDSVTVQFEVQFE